MRAAKHGRQTLVGLGTVVVVAAAAEPAASTGIGELVQAERQAKQPPRTDRGGGQGGGGVAGSAVRGIKLLMQRARETVKFWKLPKGGLGLGVGGWGRGVRGDYAGFGLVPLRTSH